MEPSRWLMIASAVAVGALVAAFAYEQWTLYRLERATSAFMESTSSTLSRSQQAIADQAARSRAAARARRAETNTGRDLERRCLEWRRHVQTSGGQYAREEMQRACDAWDRYLDGY